MRTTILTQALILGLLIKPVLSQTVSNYKYKLDNGINIVTEKGWNWVNASQTFTPIDSAPTRDALVIRIKSVGDLFGESKITVKKNNLEINPASAKEGSYVVHANCRLLSTPSGSITFEVSNVQVKPKMQTVLTVLVHDVQVSITEAPKSSKGLSYYELKLLNYKGDQGVRGEIYFFKPGTKTPRIPPAEPQGDYYGLTKPGIYDIQTLFDLNATDFDYKLWFQNMQLKPDTRYILAINLNAAELRYAGGNYEVKALQLYPAGTAKLLNEAAKPQPSKKVFGFERPQRFTLCPPGTYDVLLDYGFGVRYEWRKNVECKVGERVEVK